MWLSKFSDLYGDVREELGLTILYQAANKYFRNLEKNKTLGKEGVNICQEREAKEKLEFNVRIRTLISWFHDHEVTAF